MLSKPIPQPKPRPRALDKADRRKALVARDTAGSEAARVRSGGQCEMRLVGEDQCRRRAVHVHHLIGGIGVRGVSAESASAKAKLHLCLVCHQAVHAHILVRVGRSRFQRVS